MISPATIAQVREGTDLQALVAAYCEIRQGRILCPWHAEKRPSCRVYANGLHCFSCGEGGDCFAFLMQVEGIAFGEALKRLADAAGISLDDKPVNRVALAYARDEAALARWWWDRRKARMVAQAQKDYAGMED